MTPHRTEIHQIRTLPFEIHFATFTLSGDLVDEHYEKFSTIKAARKWLRRHGFSIKDAIVSYSPNFTSILVAITEA